MGSSSNCYAENITSEDLINIEKNRINKDTQNIRVFRIYNNKEDLPKEIIKSKFTLVCDVQTFNDNAFFYAPILFKDRETMDYFKNIDVDTVIIYGLEDSKDINTPFNNRMLHAKLI